MNESIDNGTAAQWDPGKIFEVGLYDESVAFSDLDEANIRSTRFQIKGKFTTLFASDAEDVCGTSLGSEAAGDILLVGEQRPVK